MLMLAPASQILHGMLRNPTGTDVQLEARLSSLTPHAVLDFLADHGDARVEALAALVCCVGDAWLALVQLVVLAVPAAQVGSRGASRKAYTCRTKECLYH